MHSTFSIKLKNKAYKYINTLNAYLNSYYRKFTRSRRSLPDFLIIGAQKSGTTSLYNYLIQHPKIIPAKKKEIHYFDLNYNKDLSWYKANFPLNNQLKKRNAICGEASPQYIFLPNIMDRISKEIPKVKILVLLRNPIDRTFSHYNHQVRMGRENLSFKEAIKQEERRINKGYKKMSELSNYIDYNLITFSYLHRGHYDEQVAKCYKLFPKENIKIIQSEKLYQSPNKVYQEVLDFLDLPPMELKDYKVYFSNKYNEMEPETRNYLRRYFKPHNERLFNLLGEKFDWD